MAKINISDLTISQLEGLSEQELAGIRGGRKHKRPGKHHHGERDKPGKPHDKKSDIIYIIMGGNHTWN